MDEYKWKPKSPLVTTGLNN